MRAVWFVVVTVLLLVPFVVSPNSEALASTCDDLASKSTAKRNQELSVEKRVTSYRIERPSGGLCSDSKNIVDERLGCLYKKYSCEHEKLGTNGKRAGYFAQVLDGLTIRWQRRFQTVVSCPMAICGGRCLSGDVPCELVMPSDHECSKDLCTIEGARGFVSCEDPK